MSLRKVIKSNEETLLVATSEETKAKLLEENQVLNGLLPETWDVAKILAALEPVAAQIKEAKGDGPATGVAMKLLKSLGAPVEGKDVGEAVRRASAPEHDFRGCRSGSALTPSSEAASRWRRPASTGFPCSSSGSRPTGAAPSSSLAFGSRPACSGRCGPPTRSASSSRAISTTPPSRPSNRPRARLWRASIASANPGARLGLVERFAQPIASALAQAHARGLFTDESAPSRSSFARDGGVLLTGFLEGSRRWETERG